MWPLANIPMIDYTMECLSRSPVRKVLLVCSRDTETVQTHVEQNWSGHFDEISVLRAETSNSFGDAMREVDGRGDIKSDFILIQAGTLCTSTLERALTEHRTRRNKDKSCVLTLVYREAKEETQEEEGDPRLLLAYQHSSSQLLFHREIPHSQRSRNINVPVELWSEESVRVRGDLRECGVAVCSAQVPPLFSDNFDFHNRHDLIKEIFDNEEILGFKCHVHVLPNTEFAATVTDFSKWQLIGNQILQRWSAPLVPDSLTTKQGPRYRFTGKFKYLPRNTYINAKQPFIHNYGGTVGIRLGEKVELNNCILHDNVCIENGSRCEGAVFGVGSRIAQDCTIQCRSVIGPKVEISRPGFVVPLGSFLTRECPEFDEDFEGETIPELVFYKELLECLSRAEDDTLKVENLIAEINPLRMAYPSVTLEDLNGFLIKVVLEISCKDPSLHSDDLFLKFKTLFSRLWPLLSRYIKSYEAQLDCLVAIEEFALEEKRLLDILMRVLKYLYDEDVLSEETILQWHSDLEEEDAALINPKIAKLIQWLKEADEEESDSD